MGAESGQNNADAEAAMEQMLVTSTEAIEATSGKIMEAAATVRQAYKPIPTARVSLTAYNTGCITKQLQDLYDVECRYFKHIGQLETAAQTLRNIAITYDNAEQTLVGGKERPLTPPTPPPSIDPYNPIPGGKPVDPPKEDQGGWKKEKRQFQDSDGNTEWYNEPFTTKGKIHIGQMKKENYPEYGKYSDQKTQSRGIGLDLFSLGYNEDPTKTKDGSGKMTGPFYKETGPKGSAPFAPKKVGTIAEIYADYNASWTALGAQTYKNSDYVKYKAEAYVARAEFNARAGVGAYKMKLPSGEIVNAYGLSAQVGGSFTVAGASADVDLGPTWAGVSGGASVVVVQAYANANATVGMVGGKFMAVVSGAVGVDAFKATVQGGVRLVGVEVKASASVKVGLSAKFEVGLDGGVFKANIGACIGLGVEIDISIDFSKVASALKDIGSGIVEGAKRAWRWIRRW